MLFEALFCEPTYLLLNVRGHPGVNPVLRILLAPLQPIHEVLLHTFRWLLTVNLANDEWVRDRSCSEKCEYSTASQHRAVSYLKQTTRRMERDESSGTYFLQASGLLMLPSIISALPCSFSMALISFVIFFTSNCCTVPYVLIICVPFLSRPEASSADSRVVSLRRRVPLRDWILAAWFIWSNFCYVCAIAVM